MSRTWRFAPVTEAHFEPLLAIRIEVMREHLERVLRYHPERARRVFREHFAEPGLRVGAAEVKIDSFYLARCYHNRGLGTDILKVLLAEADALGLPCELDVLLGSPADRFYERHGFVKQGEDSIEANFRRTAGARGH
jgi:GNAT superfamily N-acetyltransferase